MKVDRKQLSKPLSKRAGWVGGTSLINLLRIPLFYAKIDLKELPKRVGWVGGLVLDHSP